ncbi:Zinc Finger Protein Eos [Manis pentadactyla]|nr:Zinc Finger Protein Eos [Manis pentadactyla]
MKADALWTKESLVSSTALVTVPPGHGARVEEHAGAGRPPSCSFYSLAFRLGRREALWRILRSAAAVLPAAWSPTHCSSRGRSSAEPLGARHTLGQIPAPADWF